MFDLACLFRLSALEAFVDLDRRRDDELDDEADEAVDDDGEMSREEA